MKDGKRNLGNDMFGSDEIDVVASPDVLMPANACVYD